MSLFPRGRSRPLQSVKLVLCELRGVLKTTGGNVHSASKWAPYAEHGQGLTIGIGSTKGRGETGVSKNPTDYAIEVSQTS